MFLLCISGYILAGHGILDKKMQKVFPGPLSFALVANIMMPQRLNHLNVTLFTPALLFSKVAFFLSPGVFRRVSYLYIH